MDGHSPGALQPEGSPRTAAEAVVPPLRWKADPSYLQRHGSCSVSAKQLRAILLALGQPPGTEMTGAQLVEVLNERIHSPEALAEQPGIICQPSHDSPGGRLIYQELQAAARRRSPRRVDTVAGVAIDPEAAADALASWHAADAELNAARTALSTHAKARRALLRQRQIAEVAVNRAARAAHSVVQRVRSAENSTACPLLRVLSLQEVRDAMRLPQRLGLVGLWRLRSVCHDLRRWTIASLASLPDIIALGAEEGATDDEWKPVSKALDLSTLSWKPRDDTPLHCWMPDTPQGFDWDFCRRANGQVIAWAKPVPKYSSRDDGDYNPAKTYNCARIPGEERYRKTWTLVCWSPGQTEWKQVCERSDTWYIQAMTELSDGRLMAVGISGRGHHAISEVKILAADLSEWSTTGRMNLPRHDVILSLCRERVVAIGGFAANPFDFDAEHGGVLPPEPKDPDPYGFSLNHAAISKYNKLREQWEERMGDWTEDQAVSTVEAWDPSTGDWSMLPATKNAKHFESFGGAGGASCRSCILPSGKIMVNPQYFSTDYQCENVEGKIFDPATNSWPQDLEDGQTACKDHDASYAPNTLVSVLGGCIAFSEKAVAVYDEHNNHWYFAMVAPSRAPRGQRQRSAWDPFVSSIYFATTVALKP